MNRPFIKTAYSVSPVLSSAGAASAHHDSNADRILLTLLALDLMLLAFFVVLTSSATLDERRIREVAQGMQASFVKAHDVGGDTHGDSKAASPGDVALDAAVGALRAVVADVFATLVPHDDATAPKKETNADRVEIDVPAAVFFADSEAVLYPLPALDKLVALLSTPPAGYRMELVVRTVAASADALAQARLAALADGLVARGLAATTLSVGTLQGPQKQDAATLRFTFLLLDDENDLATLHMMAPAEKRAP